MDIHPVAASHRQPRFAVCRAGRRRLLARAAVWVAVGAALVLLIACGSSSSDSGSGTSGFSVTRTAPADGATGVSPTTDVTAYFSEVLNSSATSGAMSLVETSSNTDISGITIVFDGSTDAQFTPISALSSGAQYTATVSTAAESASGDMLASPYTWSFTTQ